MNSNSTAQEYEVVDNIEQKSSDADYERRYGEVYITRFREVIFHCTLCDEKQQDYENFLAHIMDHYYVDEAERESHSSAQSQQDLIEEPEDEYAEEPTDISNDVQFVEEVAPQNPLGEEDSTSKTSSPPSLQPLPLRPYKRTARSAEHKHKCEFCGAAFKDFRNMRAHSRRHTGEKPFECGSCKKRFYTHIELRRHSVLHKAERPYVCAYCGQDFKRPGTLREHEKRHNSLPDHKCECCEKSFYDERSLQSHMLVHTQERNHVCSVCNGKFARLRSLKQHMKLHLNAREFACDLCDMAFNQLPALQSHKANKHKIVTKSASGRVCSKEAAAAQESCPQCMLQFNDKEALLEHHRRKHPDTNEVAGTMLEQINMNTL